MSQIYQLFYLRTSVPTSLEHYLHGLEGPLQADIKRELDLPVGVEVDPILRADIKAGRKKLSDVYNGSNWLKNVFGKNEEELRKFYPSNKAVTAFQVDEIHQLYLSYQSKPKPKTSSDSKENAERIKIVVGVDSLALSGSAAAAGGIVQLASQFNALESPVCAKKVPLSVYPSDETQGPQGVIPCAHALLGREFGKEFNAFEHIIPDKKVRDEFVQAGYVQWGSEPEKFEKLMNEVGVGKLLIPGSWTKPEMGGGEVFQCFTAAPPTNAYNNEGDRNTQDRIAKALVIAQYKSLAEMAVVRSRLTGKAVPLHLTLVGGGVFNNDPKFLQEALSEVRKIIKDENVDLYLHAYSLANTVTKKALQDLLVDPKIQKIDQDTFFKIKSDFEPKSSAEVKESASKTQSSTVPSMKPSGAPPPTRAVPGLTPASPAARSSHLDPAASARAATHAAPASVAASASIAPSAAPSAAPSKTDILRQKILADATAVTRGNGVDYKDFDLPDKAFNPFIEACEAGIKSAKEESEANKWRVLLEKITYLQKSSITRTNVDLSEHPKTIIPVQEGSQLTIGDTHGNSMKLIYFLINQGVLALKEGKKDYQELVELYKKEPLNKEDLAKFDAILARATLNKGASIRFIGDEVGDRGANDYFTLKVFEKLNKGGVPVETLFSDHGAEFIRCFESDFPGDFKSRMMHNAGRSVIRLNKMVEEGLIKREDLKKLIEENYIPNLKLISYTLDEKNNHITFHSHAPVSIKTVEKLAKKFGVEYDPTKVTLQSLTKAIDEINKRFNKLAQEKGITSTLEAEEIIIREEIQKEATADGSTFGDKWLRRGGLACAGYSAPLQRVIWSRYGNDNERELIEQNKKPRELPFTISNIHGHTGAGGVPAECRERVKNLDDNIGKDDSETELGNREESLKPKIYGFRIHSNFEMSAEQYREYLAREAPLYPDRGTTSPTSAIASARILAEKEKRIAEDIRQLEERLASRRALIAAEKTKTLEVQKSGATSPIPSTATASGNIAASLQAAQNAHTEQRRNIREERSNILSAAYHGEIRKDIESIKSITVTGTVTPEKLAASYEQLLSAQKGADGNPRHPLNGASITGTPTDTSITWSKSQNKDVAHQKVEGTKVTSKINGNAEDTSLLGFALASARFEPLTLRPNNDPEKILRTMEAFLIAGVKMDIGAENKKLFSDLLSDNPKNQKLKETYALLSNKELYDETFNNLSPEEKENRKLGSPFDKRASTLEFVAEPATHKPNTI